MKLSAKLIKSEEEFIARCPELDINCYGANKNEAICRLKNVIQFYIDSAKEFGLDIDGPVAISIEGELTPESTVESKPALSSSVN